MTTNRQSGAPHTPRPVREVHWLHLGLPEARYYFGCRGHMHVFRRVGYRSGAFVGDAAIASGQQA